MMTGLLPKINRKLIKNNRIETPNNHDSIDTLTQCLSIINESLLHVINNDSIGACRNCRTTHAFIRKIHKKPINEGAIQFYYESLLDSTSAISDICKNIATTTCLSLWKELELDLLRVKINSLDKLNTNERNNIKILLTDTITEHYNDIIEDCLDDNSTSYQYLRLLQNLRIAIICSDVIASTKISLK